MSDGRKNNGANASSHDREDLIKVSIVQMLTCSSQSRLKIRILVNSDQVASGSSNRYESGIERLSLLHEVLGLIKTCRTKFSFIIHSSSLQHGEIACPMQAIQTLPHFWHW